MQPDETDEERNEQLEQDNQRPFTPADTPRAGDDTFPTTDTDVDPTELYQEGVDNPATHDDKGVAGYDPEQDQRRS